MSIAALDKLKTTTTKKVDTSGKHPVCDNEEIVEQMEEMANLKPAAKAYEATGKLIKEAIVDIHYAHYSGKAMATGTWKAGPGSITMSNSYRRVEKDALAKINLNLPDQFDTSYEVSIKSEMIPTSMQDEVFSKLIGVLDQAGCVEAITVKEKCKPKEGFHSERHIDYTLEENMEIHNLVPCTVSIRV